MKISIKREQNDASISSAEREKFGTKFKTFRLFSMAALALTMAACSSDDNMIEQQPAQQQGTIPFTATLAAPGSGAQTRTTFTPATDDEGKDIINVAWKANDEIQILNNKTYKKDNVTVGTVKEDGSATISGTITVGATGNSITAYYPASSQTDKAAFQAKFKAQDGTLKFIQDNLDYREGTGTLSVSDRVATLSSNLKMESKIAIWKLALTTDDTTPLEAEKVVIKNGDEVIASTGKISEKTSTFTLGVLLDSGDISDGDITILAYVYNSESDYYYIYQFSKTGVKLEVGKYYQSTVKMVTHHTPIQLSQVTTKHYLGSVVTSDGWVYPKASDAEKDGKTAVAMIAYMGSNTGHDTYKHGLAIALSDENDSANAMDWSTANSTCEGKTAVTGANAAWLLPSQDQWKAMFKANGGIETYCGDLNWNIENAGGTTLKTGTVYWTSTKDIQDVQALTMLIASGSDVADFSKAALDYEAIVRACLAF